MINRSKGIKTPTRGADGAREGGLATPGWFKGKESAQQAAANAASGVAAPVATHTSHLSPVSAEPTDSKKVVVDPDRQEIKLRVSYTVVGIAAFAVLATIILAVIVGKEMSGGDKPKGTETTEELLAGPAHPKVLNAQPGQGRNAAVGAEGDANTGGGAPPVPPMREGTGGTGTPTPPTNSPGEPAVVNGRVSRTMGLQYLVIQSYPETEDAQAAVDLLAKNGVPATIEKGLVGFPKWNIVVTAQGYPSKAPETTQLIRKISQISADQARKDRKWKAWDPIAYRWR